MVIVSRVANWLSYVTDKPPTITPEMVAMTTRDMFCDSAKAMRELGFKAVDLRTMVTDSVNWLKQEGYLQRWEAA